VSLDALFPAVDWAPLEALLASVDVDGLLASGALSPETQAFLDALAGAHVPDPAALQVDAAFLEALVRSGDEALAALQVTLRREDNPT
jgi:hypothetical protein